MSLRGCSRRIAIKIGPGGTYSRKNPSQKYKKVVAPGKTIVLSQSDSKRDWLFSDYTKFYVIIYFAFI